MTAVAEPLTVLHELERDRQRLNAAVSELYRVSAELHGGTGPDDQGEVTYRTGVADEYQRALDNELIALDESYRSAGGKSPAADVRAARVGRAVRQKFPELHARFLALTAQEQALRQAISGRKAAIGAAQSILRGERS